MTPRLRKCDESTIAGKLAKAEQFLEGAETIREFAADGQDIALEGPPRRRGTRQCPAHASRHEDPRRLQPRAHQHRWVQASPTRSRLGAARERRISR
jgi:hypothetical protein